MFIYSVHTGKDLRAYCLYDYFVPGTGGFVQIQNICT